MVAPGRDTTERCPHWTQRIWLGSEKDPPSFSPWCLHTGKYSEEACGRLTLLWANLRRQGLQWL